MSNTEEAVQQKLIQLIEGTDDLSMARGLAYMLLSTLTATTHEISECLCEGKELTQGILSLISENIDFIRHNIDIIQEQTKNFEALCEEIRKGKLA